MNTDLIIIGAGPGGYEMAVEAAAHGLQVVIFEENKPGGTCLNEGCIPTKALCRNAEVAETVKRAGEFGIIFDYVDKIENIENVENSKTRNFEVNMPAIQARKQAVVDQLVAGVEGLLSKPGITLVKAHAEFKDEKTVLARTLNNNGEESVEEYTAKNIVIATGSESKLLPVPGMNLPGVLTSKEMLDIDHVPQRLCVIGAGVIGLEFASIFHRLGSEVTMVEFAKEILPPFDSDIAKRLKQTLTKQGIAINTSAGVTGVEEVTATDAYGQEYNCLRVNYEQKGKACEVVADTVLVAVGRGARTAGLNLEAAGVEFTKRGITVDDNMQTNVPGIYAIGDVNARCMLAHAATFQGFRALNHILSEKDNIKLDIVPAAVFCQPEAAMVGMTEDQAKEYLAKKAEAEGTEKPAELKIGKSFFRANGKALSMGEPDGFCKLISEKDSGKILGCHLFGAHSADLIQEIAALMNKDATVSELSEIIHAHPTLGEVILAAAKS